ncbi:hypothetical protein ACFMQL_14040 [Nonomuraea fastidiosa]|uniref:hypothetical protein n=1 Tax=Nonomuraea fastidiosa TaxID=46173 RepID=UPI00366ACD06
MSFDLGVHYGQAYLLDDTDDAMGFEDLPDDHPEHPVGILRVDEGGAFLITGLHTGKVGFTVTVTDHDPGPDTEGYEDIVEVSLESEAAGCPCTNGAARTSTNSPRCLPGRAGTGSATTRRTWTRPRRPTPPTKSSTVISSRSGRRTSRNRAWSKARANSSLTGAHHSDAQKAACKDFGPR